MLSFHVVAGGAAPFRCTREALAWARDHGVIGKLLPEESGGKGVVGISAESIRESLNPRQRAKSVSDEIHFAAITVLRDLIRESVIVEEHGDWLKGADGVRGVGNGVGRGITICIAYAAMSVLGVVYRVRLTLKRYAQTGTSKAYAYRVNEIEVLPGTLGGRPKLATNPTGGTSIYGNILLQRALDVNGAPLICNLKIVSGGQTGVDRGGLEAAVAQGLEFGGWAPYRWLAERWPKEGGGKENGSVPEGYRRMMREYADCGSSANNYRERTKANVRDSHATLILVDALPVSGGTKLTVDTAVAMMRPHLVVDMSAANAKADALNWLRHFLATTSSFVLNIAGPRESKAVGIQAKAKAFLQELLSEA